MTGHQVRVGVVLRAARRKLGLTQSQVCEGIPDYGHANLSRVENGTQSIPDDKRALVALRLGMTVSEVHTAAETRQMFEEERGELIHLNRGQSGQKEVKDLDFGYRQADQVPYFKNLQLQPGDRMAAPATHLCEHTTLNFRKDFFTEAGANPAAVFVFRHHDTNMSPIISADSDVAINTGATSVARGKIYAINHRGLLRLVRLYQMPDGLRVVHENPNCPEEFIPANQLDHDVIILGRAFWVARLI